MAARRSTFALLLAALILSACGGGTEPAAVPSTPASPTESTPATGSTVTIDQTVWFAGFKITLEEATLVPRGDAARVDIDALFANEGGSNATFRGTVNLTAGTESYSVDFAEQDLPEVPGDTVGSGKFAFYVEDPSTFSFDAAVLTFGTGESNNASVPLGTEGELVTQEPTLLDVSGRATGGELRVKLEGGEVRADIPDRHVEVEADRLAITLDFDVTYLGDHGGGYAFGEGNLALEQPDGTTLAPDDGPIELIRAGTSLTNQRVRFIIEAPAEGDYALVVIDDTIDKRAKIAFTI